MGTGSLDKRVVKVVVGGTLATVAAILILMSFYVIDEGHVGIVKRFGEAITQNKAGLHTKIPIVDSVEIIEIRTKRNIEKLAAATSEQMPIQAEVSVNWTVNRESAFKLFVDYGGLDQFENRILDSRLRSAAKGAISKYTAEQIIVSRSEVISSITISLEDTMKDFPVSLDSVQLDNIELPPNYLKSIETKQTEKNLAAAEQHKLDRQKLQAQQAVNTASAEADSKRLVARAEADSIKMIGEAEADSIKAKAAALKSNPLIVELTLAQRWDGAQPRMVTGNGGMILQMNSSDIVGDTVGDTLK
jgi:regulator of protease activity HflC (stomatin/prohibitin superfamily)